MGKITGFLEIERHDRKYAPVAERVTHFHEFVAPLCRTHHREVHRVGNEPAWWKRAGIDPIQAARKLWESTRLNGGSPSAPPIGRTDGAGGNINI